MCIRRATGKPIYSNIRFNENLFAKCLIVLSTQPQPVGMSRTHLMFVYTCGVLIIDDVNFFFFFLDFHSKQTVVWQEKRKQQSGI